MLIPDYIEEIERLTKENQELKKQLENYRKLGFKHLQDKNNNLETQQKELINYLENEIKELQKIKKTELDYDILKDVIPQLLVYKEILSKYKEIIGVSNENNMEKSK